MNQVLGIIEREAGDAFWAWGLSKWINEGIEQGWVMK